MRILTLPRRVLRIVALSMLASLGLLTVVPTFADEPSGAQLATMGAAMGAILLFAFVIFAVFYIYWALATQTIAKKTNTENGWMAWIPVANLVLWANIAKKPVWWGLLCLIPLVNIVFMILLWMGIAEARKKPSWWGIILIVPVVGIIVPGYLAWAD